MLRVNMSSEGASRSHCDDDRGGIEHTEIEVGI